MIFSLLRSFHREHIVPPRSDGFSFSNKYHIYSFCGCVGRAEDNFRELVSPSATWVLGIKCGSDFGASASVHRTNSPAQNNGFLERREASSKERGGGEERGS